ncbi:MAG: hypothetical protein IMZ58_02140 [Thermoplasmata archaeon]|nr:hypothetical protein [Thermoplasmata archaeon]
MTTKTNKILSAAVVIAIIVSVAVLVYVNLPKQTDSSSEDNTAHKTTPPVFTLIYDDQQTNFTIGDLAQLETYTAKGGYRTQSGMIKGVGNYTGVNISTLVSMFHPAPLPYSLRVYSEDGKNLSINYSTILGNVDIYNPDNASDPNPIGKGGVTMVLAYQYEGNWLNESSDGKLKIVFLDEQGSITAGHLWLYKVTSIKIITE